MKNNYHSILKKECTLSGPLAGVLVDTNHRLCNCCRVFLAFPQVFSLLGNSIKTSLKGLETEVKLAAHHSFSSFIPLICSHKTQKDTLVKVLDVGVSNKNRHTSHITLWALDNADKSSRSTINPPSTEESQQSPDILRLAANLVNTLTRFAASDTFTVVKYGFFFFILHIDNNANTRIKQSFKNFQNHQSEYFCTFKNLNFLLVGE